MTKKDRLPDISSKISIGGEVSVTVDSLDENELKDALEKIHTAAMAALGYEVKD